jgi:hypothetical protein
MNSIAFWVYPSSIKLIWVLKKVSIEFSTYIDSIQTQTIHTTINFFHPLQNLKKKPSIFEEILFPNTISKHQKGSNELMRYWKCFQWKVWVTLPCSHWSSLSCTKNFKRALFLENLDACTRTVLCSELQGNISRHILDFLAEEVRRVERINQSAYVC